MFGYVWSCLTWILSLVVIGASGSLTKENVMIGRCRANCLDTFLPRELHIYDSTCRSKANCNMCWVFCEDLFTSYNLYGLICDETKLCTRGCQTACNFRRNPPSVRKVQEWAFLETVMSETDSVATYLKWKAPEPTSLAHSAFSLVYTVLVRNKGRTEDWRQLIQIASREASFETDKLPDPAEFQLVASTHQGVVARSTFSVNSPIIETYHPRKSSFSGSNSATYVPDVGPLNISIDMQLVDKQLQLSIQWTHPKREVVKCARAQEPCFYDIDWFLLNCAAYPESPACENLPYHAAETTHFPYSVKPSFILPDVKFNTEYRVSITIHDSHNHPITGEVFFKTPLCRDVDIDRTRCHDSIDMFVKSNPVVETADVIANLTAMPNDSPSTSENRGQKLMELKIDEKPKMIFDTATSMMDVNITWSTVLNQSVFEKYVVSWYIIDDYYRIPSKRSTKNTFLGLKLEVDCNYDITVQARYQNDNNKSAQIEKSITLFTAKNLSSPSVQAQPITQNDEHDLSTVSGIIVGVIVATVLIVVFVVIFYKKRKSFKDIIVTKTLVTKSNSYKSNVGAGKSNYSNQLMVISDEWELDPKLLKFSTQLGQGAFGKVVTGFYSDQKVAIKLVKEGAPLSYKEDLVAEINLMKRVGSHPNIVALIGAITINEPIALIMEFVPHGNLQNFLKRCRLEGDLRKRADGASELMYAMIHDSGGIENYVISPPDMLSFARQVAMAMEYLTDRRYVHRDLAARNILLGQNKVVKLCDFGLSRDIYNDNQYQKLTNGKLPLKWMAIESLRDRVFTTQSDVWSFGILLWEIVTMGASPYPHIALSDLYYVLVNGYRMEKTSNCSEELYAIMLQCWSTRPNDRPCFTQLRMMLEELLEQDRDYLVLENINVPLNTSENSSNESSLEDISAQPSGTSPVRMPTLGKESLRVNVCIHEKSTDRLLRKSESDSSP